LLSTYYTVLLRCIRRTISLQAVHFMSHILTQSIVCEKGNPGSADVNKKQPAKCLPRGQSVNIATN